MSRLRVITFKASDEFIEELDRVSKILGIGRSDLIRYALNEVLSRDIRILRKSLTYSRYGICNGVLDIVSRDIVCLDLTVDEILRLKKINDDPVKAIKHLIRVVPL